MNQDEYDNCTLTNPDLWLMTCSEQQHLCHDERKVKCARIEGWDGRGWSPAPCPGLIQSTKRNMATGQQALTSPDHWRMTCPHQVQPPQKKTEKQLDSVMDLPNQWADRRESRVYNRQAGRGHVYNHEVPYDLLSRSDSHSNMESEYMWSRLTETRQNNNIQTIPTLAWTPGRHKWVMRVTSLTFWCQWDAYRLWRLSPHVSNDIRLKPTNRPSRLILNPTFRLMFANFRFSFCP